MSESAGIIIGAVIAMISAIVVQIIQGRLGKKRGTARKYVEQFASFYELEKLYVSEISRLEKIVKEKDKSDNEIKIKNDFRKQNELNGCEHIEFTSNSAKLFARKLVEK